MQKEKIFVIEDEEDIAEIIRFNLQREGFEVKVVYSGNEAISRIKQEMPKLILLDLMLPGIDGLTLFRLLKQDAATKSIPVIMVTAKGEETDIVTGLELGADDYIPKPFKIRELIARVKSVMRKKTTITPSETDDIQIGEIRILPEKHEIYVNDQLVKLTQTEFKILHAMARKPGRVFTRYQIVDVARGSDAIVTDRSVDVHIVSIRRKLGSAGKRIETVHGVGYKFLE
ncbi:MAG: response regulator [bacterium]|nr:response regulator [bacterium]